MLRLSSRDHPHHLHMPLTCCCTRLEVDFSQYSQPTNKNTQFMNTQFIYLESSGVATKGGVATTARQMLDDLIAGTSYALSFKSGALMGRGKPHHPMLSTR